MTREKYRMKKKIDKYINTKFFNIVSEEINDGFLYILRKRCLWHNTCEIKLLQRS